MEQNNDQMNFDPNTGEPINQAKYNPNTGEPIGQQQPTHSETAENDSFMFIPKKNWSLACLILGIVSVVFAWLGYGAIIGIAAGIIGIIFVRKTKDVGISDGQITAGLIMSIIGIIGGALMFTSYIACTTIAACISCAAY